MNTIAGEFGGTVPHSLSEYYRGGGLVPNAPVNAAIPTSGTISMGNFYGATNRVPISLTISTNSFNYDVFANRGPAYVAGASDVVVTVNPGVTVGSTSTGAAAMLVPSGFSPGDTVTIVNNGAIQGRGGNGGNGASSPPTATSGGPGGGGGSAISVSRPTVITNNGVVAGGGGGGGGGGLRNAGTAKLPQIIGGGGGGGGAGVNGGSGGSGGPAPAGAGTPGGGGTSTTGGAGGPGGGVLLTAGGTGGGRGASGTAGGTGSTPGGSGGGGGNYIVGNPFVTWPATGTRLGGVA